MTTDILPKISLINSFKDERDVDATSKYVQFLCLRKLPCCYLVCPVFSRGGGVEDCSISSSDLEHFLGQDKSFKVCCVVSKNAWSPKKFVKNAQTLSK